MLVFFFCIVSLGVIASGLYYFKSQQQHLFESKLSELSSIIDLKTRQINQMRLGRIGEAKFFNENKFLIGKFKEFSGSPGNRSLRADLIESLRSFATNFNYKNILFTDPAGIVKISFPVNDTVLGDYLRSRLPGIIKERKGILTDLHKSDRISFVHLDLVFPLIDHERKDSAIFGLLALRIDPMEVLFPLVQKWPSTSSSAESYLIRREGDEILYLNELRNIKNTDLSFKKPISEVTLPEVMAINGANFTTKGIDYRGVSVVAAMKTVPGTVWYMVAKIDRKEILSSLDHQRSMGIIIMILFILATGSMLAILWRNQRVRFYREKLEIEQNRLALIRHFEYIAKYANDIILLIGKDLKILDANDRALEVYQYSREELIGMSCITIRPEELVPNLYQQIEILEEKRSDTFETIHKRKDGTVFPIEISARLVEIEGIKYYHSIGRDITDRKIVEETLKKSEEKYRELVESANSIIDRIDTDGRLIFVNEYFLKFFGFTEKEVIGKSVIGTIIPESDSAGKDLTDLIENLFKDPDHYITNINENISKNGTRSWISWTNKPILDKNGQIIEILSVGNDITKLKHAENLLRQREFWLSESQRVGRIGSYEMDIRAGLWISSDVLDDIFGLSKDSPKTLESWSMVVHPDQREEMVDYFLNHVIKEKKPFDREYRIIKNNSIEECWVLGRGELSYDKEGNPEKMFGTIQDITERKISEILIIESEERFRKIFEESPISTAMTAMSFNLLRVNPSFCSMLGYNESEIIGLTFRDFTHTDHLNESESGLKQLISGNIPVFKIEKRYIRKDKSIIWGSTTVSSIKDRNGRIQYFLVMIEDITSRKEADILIEESNSLLRATLESTADGILVVDLKGKIVEFNKKFTEMWEIPETILSSRDDEKALSFVRNQLKEPDSFLNNVRHLYENPDSVSFDNLDFNDGRIFERYSQPQKINNEIIGRVWSFRDITQRKIAEDLLISAKEKAVESDKLKTAFLHNISHEIRTPMNAIVGFTALLDDPVLVSETRKQYIDIIYQSSNQLLSIITDIVDISNIETGQTRVSSNQLNINIIIRNLYEQFSLRAEELGLSLHFKLFLNDDLAFMETDSTKLIQIMSNLLNNSLKFTKRGKIEFGYEVKDESVEFMVSDTGIGISKDKQEKIFDRFYQVENSISRQYSGTGLGLSICRAYAELLGGSIRVESEPGTGSTFYLTLPYKSSVKSILPGESVHEKSKGSFEGKTILVAEDDDINYLVVNKSLKDYNLKLIRAENGKDAVEICRSNNEIDLVLLDLKMPVMDGLEAMRLIREFRPNLSFIALTAYAFESDKKNAIAQGCSDYISKPFSKNDLLEVMKKHL
jgi:PAS domain S-box-containing protein